MISIIVEAYLDIFKLNKGVYELWEGELPTKIKTNCYQEVFKVLNRLAMEANLDIKQYGD